MLMAEITNVAYSDLKNYIKNEWKCIELRTDNDAKILRLNSDDSRVTSNIIGNEIQLQVVLKGSDLDLKKPLVFAKSVLFKDMVSLTSLCEESFTPFNMESDSDELTIIHTIQVPKVL